MLRSRAIDRPPRPSFPLPAIAVVAVVLLTGACGSETAEAPTDESLVVERTTDADGVTTVRNVSGSTWGGPAHLAEELSIGVLEADEAYMLGRVGGLWVTDAEVYVVDVQVPAIRVYDHEGRHLRDIGRQGQGPGEYGRPGDVAVLADGTVVLNDRGNRRLVFFDAAGQPLRTWSADEGYVFGVTALDDGRALLRRGIPKETRGGESARVILHHGAVAPLSADGEPGELRLVPELDLEEEPLIIEEGGRGIMFGSGGILFRPTRHWTARPDGAIVVGVSDDYRFEIHGADGAVTIVSRYWDPVPLDSGEIDYAIARVEGQVRQMFPAWTYDGPPPPTTRPAYDGLTADRDSRVWALRRLQSRRVQDCAEDPREDPEGAYRRPCWKPGEAVDAFAPDGTYLGELQRPGGLTFQAVFIRGDAYWAAVEDEDGLVTVRRFRIVTPGTT